MEALSLATPGQGFAATGFAATLEALCDCIVRAQCEPVPEQLRERQSEVTRFVVDQQARMPDYLVWPLRLATLFFDYFGLVHDRRLFHSQDQDARWRQIQAWRSSVLPPARDFIRFYESLILYCWYSNDEQ